jgi:hypothetical protein
VDASFRHIQEIAGFGINPLFPIEQPQRAGQNEK